MITNGIRPSSISARHIAEAGFRFGGHSLSSAGKCLFPHIQRDAVELVGVADDEVTAMVSPARGQTEHHPPSPPFLVNGKTMRQILPGGAADAIGRLFHHHRGLFENIAHDRGDVRMIMMARMTPAARIPIPNAGPANGLSTNGMVSRTLPTGSGSKSQTAGRKPKQAPHAVHDAQDCRQQLNRNAQRTAGQAGTILSETARCRSSRNGDQQRDEEVTRVPANRDQRRRISLGASHSLVTKAKPNF